MCSLRKRSSKRAGWGWGVDISGLESTLRTVNTVEVGKKDAGTKCNIKFLRSICTFSSDFTGRQ